MLKRFAPNLGARQKHLNLHLKQGQVKMEKTIHSKAYKALREWLVQIRYDNNLTQRQLASLLEVPYSWVGKVEQGERRLDIIEYIRMYNTLEVDPIDGLHIVSEVIDK